VKATAALNIQFGYIAVKLITFRYELCK